MCILFHLKQHSLIGVAQEVTLASPEHVANVGEVKSLDACEQLPVNISETKNEIPDYLHDLFDRASSNLNNQETKALQELISKYKCIFASPDGPLGRTSITKHKINTGDHPPIKQPTRRLPIEQAELASKEVDDMLRAGVIEPSDSAWSSPIVLVKKKDGSTRFCVDRPVVRKYLLDLQREMGKDKGAVFEGRDMGTVVFPKAEAPKEPEGEPIDVD